MQTSFIILFKILCTVHDKQCTTELSLHCEKYNKLYYIVIHIFLLISMEKNRAIYPCICTIYVYCTISKIS